MKLYNWSKKGEHSFSKTLILCTQQHLQNP